MNPVGYTVIAQNKDPSGLWRAAVSQRHRQNCNHLCAYRHTNYL